MKHLEPILVRTSLHCILIRNNTWYYAFLLHSGMKSTMNDPGVPAAIIEEADSSAALMKISPDSLISIPYVIRIIMDAVMLTTMRNARRPRKTYPYCLILWMKSSGWASTLARNSLDSKRWYDWYFSAAVLAKCSWNSLRCLRHSAP